MPSDIVERLRTTWKLHQRGAGIPEERSPLLRLAADEIERLRAELRRVAEAARKAGAFYENALNCFGLPDTTEEQMRGDLDAILAGPDDGGEG